MTVSTQQAIEDASEEEGDKSGVAGTTTKRALNGNVKKMAVVSNGGPRAPLSPSNSDWDSQQKVPLNGDGGTLMGTWPLQRRASGSEGGSTRSDVTTTKETSVASSAPSTEAPSTTLLLRLRAQAFPIEVLQATVFDTPRDSVAAPSGAGSGIFYERAVDELLVIDEAKKLLYCVRKQNGTSANGPFDEYMTAAEGRRLSASLQQQQQPRLTRPPFAVAAAAARWRKKCRQRRMLRQRRLQQLDAMGAAASADNARLLRDDFSTVKEESEEKEQQEDDAIKVDDTAKAVAVDAATATAKKSSPLPTPPPPMVRNPADHETDIEERILRRKEMAHLFHW